MPESRARAARAAPRDPRMSLPGGWARAVDPSTNLPYYHNVARGITSWDPPGSPPGSAELVSAIARARVMAEFEAARRGGRGLDSGAGRPRRRGGDPLGTPSAPRDRDADVHPRGAARPNAGESRVEPAKGRGWGGDGDDAGDAKRAKRGADERPPAPVEPRPGVGGSIGGDGEAAAVGMDGTSGARDTAVGASRANERMDGCVPRASSRPSN